MDVTCTSCGAKLKIPDSKLPPPQVRTVSITCPKCKSTLKIDRTKPDAGVALKKKADVKPERDLPPKDKAKTGEPAKDRVSKEAKKDRRGIIFDYEYDEDISPLEFYEEGTKLALILDGDAKRAKEISSVLEELSYRTVVPASIKEAMGKVLFHHFDLIMLSDGFDGLAVAEGPLINYLNRLSMSVRRRIFLVLLSTKFKTMDLMKALGMSANLVVNPDDLSNLSLILKKGVSDNNKFYKVFLDTLVETGKD
jgi:CheY-like chemotaxis protein